MPVIEYCKEHIFWKWPDKIFEQFDQEYINLVSELRGPGNSAFANPPVTLMVLDRARSRDDIPRAIVEIRDEYAIDRKNLWEHLVAMWSAHSLREKKKLKDDLERASRHLFQASFPSIEGAFEFAVDTAENIVFGGMSGLKNVGKHLEPRISVGGVSLVGRLAKDFSKHLVDDRDVLSRHLTTTERKAFGIE